jgi:hypothetical protein
MTILDGRARTGLSLADFYQRPDILHLAARQGVAIPSISQVDEDAPPALAQVNPLDPFERVSRWIATCPDCPGGTAYVWTGGPHLMWCLACCNSEIGHKWRRVVLPPNRKEIERLLDARPLSSLRAWVPGETVEQLRAENEHLGV